MREVAFEITPEAYEKLKVSAEQAYPAEGCGVLAAGAQGVIEEVFVLENIAEEIPSRRYGIDPLQLYELEKREFQNGYGIAGFFHSHPDCVAYPSGEDADHMIPKMLYVIASVENGQCREIKGYMKEQ